MRNKNFATLGVLALIAAASTFGQQRMTSDIPFEFQFGKIVLPAGNYDVTMSFSHIPGVLSLKCKSCKTSEVVVRTDSIAATDAQPQSTLVFNRYGNRYFLAKVNGFAGGSMLTKSTAERELARNTPKSEAGQIMLALR